MYGLGIRIGFYMQWYGQLLAGWLAPLEVAPLRITNTLFISASFIALIIQWDELQIIEVYVAFLLFFGSMLIYMPSVLLWRLLTCCNPLFDPTRFPRIRPPGKPFNFLFLLVVMAVLSFMLWFWIVRVPTLDDQPCGQNGFMFIQIPLNNQHFQNFHTAWCVLLLGAAVVLVVLRFLNDDNNPLPENLR